MKSFVLHPVIEQVTNIKVPMGGERAPMALLKIYIMAKWTSSIPYALATGANKGTKMIMEALPSTNIPTMSRNALTKIRKIYLLSMVLTIHSVSCWGIRSRVSIQENTVAAATMNMMK